MSEPTELDILKARAKKMGIKYHANIGAEKLREKVASVMNNAPVQEPVSVKTPEPIPLRESRGRRASRKRREARQLVRVNITCMNPNKREYEGENFTFSNSLVGTIARYVPYTATDGWHIERGIFNMLKEKKCQIFKTKKDGRGRKVRRGELINEFSIQVLPDLTPVEMKELATRQAMANNQED